MGGTDMRWSLDWPTGISVLVYGEIIATPEKPADRCDARRPRTKKPIWAPQLEAETS